MNFSLIHRSSAIVIAAFALLHMANHLAAFAGVPAHLAVMASLRTIYRQPQVEALLLVCVLIQVISGSWLVIRGWKERQGIVPWLQAGSGMYLAFFLAAHVSGVFFGRFILSLDTNFYYSAAGLHVAPYQYFFAPYYFLAIVALFSHLSCAIYWSLDTRPAATRTRVLRVGATLGLLTSLSVVLMLAGLLRPLEVLPQYKAPYLSKSSASLN